MRRAYWAIGLAVAGLFLAAKELDWLYDSRAHKVAMLALYGAIGAIAGVCFSVAISRSKTWARLLGWMASFALMGLAVGHGNVSRLFTLRVMAIAGATGALIGTLQLIVSRRTQRPNP